ncbi:MAG: hypothetical protein WCU88_07555 [Elusimicrobiota bacterium]
MASVSRHLAAASAAALLCGLSICAQDAHAAGSTKTRMRAAKTHSRSAAGGERKRRHRKISARKAPAVEIDRIPLGPGRWTPAVRDRLEHLLASKNLSAGAETPTVIVALESVAQAHDPGDALFQRLVDRAEFRFDDDFWKLIPEPFGRERIRAALSGFKDQPSKLWPKEESYPLYRKAFYAARKDICAAWSARECARWRATLLSGYLEPDLRAAVRELIGPALAEPVRIARVGDFPEDPEGVEIVTGLRKVPELEALFRALERRGCEIWFFSRSDQWSAEGFAKLYGIPPGRVAGVRSIVRNGTLSAEIVPPVPQGEGAVEAVARFIGRPPVLALGGPGDEGMLRLAQASVFFSTAGAVSAQAAGYVQPRFSALREPQRIVSAEAEQERGKRR